MVDRCGEFNFFQGIHVKSDIRTDVSIRPMTTKILQTVKSRRVESNGSIRCWSCHHVKIAGQNKKHFSFTRVSIATNLDTIVTYLDGLLPIKSHDLLITWSSEIT